jgi:tetratricopeptide (TPR) repeat protein
MPQDPFLAGRLFIRTLALTLLAIAMLFATDVFLAKTERTEARTEAVRLFAEGQLLTQQGRGSDAIERFKDATSMERTNREFRLALADALLLAGRSGESEHALNDLLEKDSTDGAANLSMARVLVKQGMMPEAISFYHRAIYGQWASNPAANRVKTRFELIDLLARLNAKEELLAELLPLQDEAPADIENRKRIGRLFIAAGSPSHAADVFRDILRRHPQDPDAFAGLGDADFARGNYQTAQGEFLTALRLKPEDQNIRQRLDACSQVLMLDPTRRGLTASERYHRSIQLLELTLNQVSKCAANSSTEGVRDLVNEAGKAAKRPASQSRQSEATEANLDLAERLWQIRKRECREALAGSEDPLTLVLAKVAQ